MTAKLATLETEKLNLVEELKNDRSNSRTKLDSKDAEIANLTALLADAAKKNNAAPTEEEKIASVVATVLAQRDGLTATQNKKLAFDQFVNAHTEYHPDNDVGGLKLAALSQEFASFNTAGLVSVDDFGVVVGKAHLLLRGTDTSRQTENQPILSSPAPASQPRQVVLDGKLTPLEQAVVARNGWTEERYLKLKESNPELVESLVRDAPPH